MQLKRLYDDTGNVCGVRVLHVGPKQRFSTDLVLNAAMEGWLLLSPNRITIRGDNKDVVYRIVRRPGYHCSHCNVMFSRPMDMADHVEAAHPGLEKPGYELLKCFECEVIDG